MSDGASGSPANEQSPDAKGLGFRVLLTWNCMSAILNSR